MAKPMKYTQRLDLFALAVDEILVPHYCNLVDLLALMLTSKQLGNKINQRPNIGLYVKATLGIPVNKGPTLKVKTFFTTRGASHCDKLPHSMKTEYALAMQSACVLCLGHNMQDRREFRKGDQHREGLTGPFLFTNGIDPCPDCANLPSWKRGRQECKHPTHIFEVLAATFKLRGQPVCQWCGPKAGLTPVKPAAYMPVEGLVCPR